MKKTMILIFTLLTLICFCSCKSIESKSGLIVGQSIDDVINAYPNADIFYVEIGSYYTISDTDIKIVVFAENGMIKSFTEYTSDSEAYFCEQMSVLNLEKEIWEYLGTPYTDFKSAYGEPNLYRTLRYSAPDSSEIFDGSKPVYLTNDGKVIVLTISGFYGTSSDIDYLYRISVHDIFSGRLLHEYNNLLKYNGTERGEVDLQYELPEYLYEWKGKNVS